MRFRWSVLVLLAALAPFLRATENQPLRHLTDADIAAWSQMYGDPLLTPDGKWLTYIWSAYDDSSGAPRKGVPQLIVRSTDSDAKRRYALGRYDGPKTVRMSPSGRWIAFTKAASNGGAMVSLMEVGTGNSRDFEEGMDFAFSADERWLAIQGTPTPDAGYSLSLHRLAGRDDVKPWDEVREHAMDVRGRFLAIAGVELRVLDLDTGQERVLESKPECGYGTLRWSPSGRSLALVRTQHGARSVLVVRDVGRSTQTSQVFEPARWKGFPPGFELATQDALMLIGQGPLMGEVLRWRDDEDGLFFNIKPIEPALGEQGQTARAADLLLWHWKDPLLPAHKRFGTLERHLAFLSLPDGRFVRLADETLTNVLPQGRGQYALGFSWRQYGTHNAIAATNSLNGMQKRDYSLVSLKTGEHRALAQLRAIDVHTNAHISLFIPSQYADGTGVGPRYVEPQLSPDGSVVIYPDGNEDYHAYDVRRRTDRNITAGLPGWALLKMPKNVLEEPSWLPNRPQGWSADGRFMFLSDGYDVWALPLKGGAPFNVTGNGRRDGVVYRYTDIFAWSDQPQLGIQQQIFRHKSIDLQRPIYFATLDLKSFREGLAVRRPDRTAAQVLASEDASVIYYKARRAPTLLAQRTTLAAGKNFYSVDEQGRLSRQLTELTPQQKKFSWPTAQILRFKSSAKDGEYAALYAPPGAVPGKAYPTIVVVDLGLAPNLIHIEDPRIQDRFHWLRQGYAVLMPDIHYRPGESGAAALQTTLAAVDAAVATGIVDPERLGLWGHSSGGYEAFYIASRSNIFKAVAPVAGFSNMQSHYNGIVVGEAGSLFTEAYELPAPWWEDRAALERNSPIERVTDVHTPMLIGHGDADVAVPFNQSVEMFIALRRLQDRPVVLLQYAGWDHDVHNNPDFMERERQFFAHFLKGEPAPAWWTKGVSYWKGTAPAPAAQP